MYTGTAAQDWSALGARGAQAVQYAEAGLPWEQAGVRIGSDQDTWLLSFIDVLTLLLTLFVLLLAYQRDAVDRAAAAPAAAPTEVAAPAAQPPMQPIDTASVPVAPPAAAAAPGQAAVALPAIVPTPIAYPAIGSAGTERRPTAAPRPHPLLALAWPLADAPAAIDASDAADAPPATEPEVTQAPAERSDDRSLQRLLTELERSALAGRVEVSVLPGAVNLEISDHILFAPASAALTVGGRALLDDLAATLKTLPYALSVEGHTDDVPIRTARYPSNWELAAARASTVTRHLIESGLAAGRMRAIGYAETRPRADNLTSAGRARNRRVAFVLRMPDAATPAVR